MRTTFQPVKPFQPSWSNLQTRSSGPIQGNPRPVQAPSIPFHPPMIPAAKPVMNYSTGYRPLAGTMFDRPGQQKTPARPAQLPSNQPPIARVWQPVRPAEDPVKPETKDPPATKEPAKADVEKVQQTAAARMSQPKAPEEEPRPVKHDQVQPRKEAAVVQVPPVRQATAPVTRTVRITPDDEEDFVDKLLAYDFQSKVQLKPSDLPVKEDKPVRITRTITQEVSQQPNPAEKDEGPKFVRTISSSFQELFPGRSRTPEDAIPPSKPETEFIRTFNELEETKPVFQWSYRKPDPIRPTTPVRQSYLTPPSSPELIGILPAATRRVVYRETSRDCIPPALEAQPPPPTRRRYRHHFHHPPPLEHGGPVVRRIGPYLDRVQRIAERDRLGPIEEWHYQLKNGRYVARIAIGGKLFGTYPDDFRDLTEALDAAAEKAYDYLLLPPAWMQPAV